MSTLILTVVAVAKMMSAQAQLVSCDGAPVKHTVAVQVAYQSMTECGTDTECEDAAATLNSLNVCGW